MYYTNYKYDRLHHITFSLSFGSCIVTLLKLECSPPVQTIAVLNLKEAKILFLLQQMIVVVIASGSMLLLVSFGWSSSHGTHTWTHAHDMLLRMRNLRF